MLNIEDINKRIKENPIPKEIYDVRERITNFFKGLEFIEDGHKYFLTKDDGTKKEMESVTTSIHIFEPHVDWESILEKKALKENMPKESLKRKWHENNILSTSNGSLTHLFAEGYMHFFMGEPELIPEVIKKMQYEDGYLIPYGNKQMAVAKYYEDLFSIDNFYPIMPEAMVYIDSEKNPYGIKKDISGTFDALFGYFDKKGELKLSIRDWKTNKSLENIYNRANEKTLLYPFDSIEYIDEPKSIYTLQLSLYQLCLEQTGYNISDRKLLWLTEDGKYHKIDTPDVREKLIKGFSR